jgi:hypothetical protein
MESVPGAVATLIETRSLPLPVLTSRAQGPQAAKPHHEPNQGSHHSRFTILCYQLIGFDRSAFVAGPHCGLGNQNVNRVYVQFMTKVFRSVLSKIRKLD